MQRESTRVASSSHIYQGQREFSQSIYCYLWEVSNAASSIIFIMFHMSCYLHPWVSMVAAIAFELMGTIHAKASGGLTVARPSCIMLCSYLISVIFLSFALDKSAQKEHGGIDLGIAYATWSGLGTMVAAMAGVYLYGETLITAQWFGILLTMAGLIIINAAPSFNRTEEFQASVVDLDSSYSDSEVSSFRSTVGMGSYGATA